MSRLRQSLALALGLMATGAVCAQGVPAGAGTVYKATPPPPYGTDAAAAPPTPMSAQGAPDDGAGSRVTSAGGAAPVAPGAGVEIISGGTGSSDGAAKVGRMPVLQ